MSCSSHARAHSTTCGRLRWKPIELATMILGFIVFFPIGLAILAWKIYQSKSVESRDFAQFAQEKWGAFEQRSGLAGMARRFSDSAAPTGNSAFDDWRRAELARLDEERRKIFEAEKAFEDYLDGLRRARDCEEFERFMASRSPKATDQA